MCLRVNFISLLQVNLKNGIIIDSNWEIISPYSVRMRENPGKMRTRITPNTDSFYAVLSLQLCQKAAG